MRLIGLSAITRVTIFGMLLGASSARADDQPAAPAAPTVTSKPKPKKKKTEAPPPPEDTGPVSETTKIEPEIVYRMSSLKVLETSPFHRETHRNFVNQIFATLHLTRTYDYIHTVVVEPTFRTKRNNPSENDETDLVQAYIESSPKGWLTVTGGKKAEFSGSGFFTNPSDLLNEGREQFDALYQDDGVPFGRLLFRKDDYSLGLGFIPTAAKDADEGRAWMTLSGQLLDVDLKAQATHNAAEKTTTGFSAQRFFGASFEVHTDDRWQTRQRHQIQNLDNSFPEQYSAYSGPDPGTTADDDPSGYYLVGTRYVISHQRSIVLESITNQAGLLPEELATMYAALRQDSTVDDPPTQIIGRHYAFFGYQDSGLAKRFHLALNALQNTDDNSAFASLTLRYHFSPISSVELQPTVFKGGAESEFGARPFSRVGYLAFRGRF
jgi:hypothetical protein